MKRSIGILLILILCGTLGVAAQTTTRGFGFGGAIGRAFFPDMTGVNAFMSEYGLPSMGSFLVGPGGNGRGGALPGPVFGGIGWGLMAFSENDVLSAELISAGGGFDMGRAIGGDDGSVLTVGLVLGGGANILGIDGYIYPTVDPQGLVPEPTYREIVYAHGFVEPYVSMAAEIFPWMGFELRLGYHLSVYGAEFGDIIGIPTPSLDFSGPTVSFGIVFGAVGSGRAREAAEERAQGNREVTVSTDGSFEIASDAELMINNTVGSVVVSSYEVAEAAPLVVEWQGTKTVKEKKLDELQIVTEIGDGFATIETIGPGLVEYVIRVPSGVDLKVKTGVGEVKLVGHSAQTIIVDAGVGELHLQDVDATALFVNVGLGEITLEGSSADHLIVEAGIGAIQLGLVPSTSATLTAEAGIGEINIDKFPVMIGGTRGWISQSADVVLAEGAQTIELEVGLGEINVEVDF